MPINPLMVARHRLHGPNVVPSPHNLADLSSYLFIVRPRDDAAANHLWQQNAKTTHATGANDPVQVVSASVSPLSPHGSTIDLAETSGNTRLIYGTDSDGVSYFQSQGTATDTTLANATALSTIGTGSFHGFAWVRRNASDRLDGILASIFSSIRVSIDPSGTVTYTYGAQSVIGSSSEIASGKWQVVQLGFDADTSEMVTKANDADIIRTACDPSKVADNFYLAPYFLTAGARIGCFAMRNVKPVDDEYDAVWLAGPNGDGVNWPPPLSVTADVLFSGGIVRCLFPSSFTLGTGNAVVTIDGDDVTCPRVYQIAPNELWIRIPTADICTDSGQVVTLTFPAGFLDLGSTTNHAVTNNTGVETLLPMAPPVNAGDIAIGNNLTSPQFFTIATMFSNAAHLLSAREDFGATVVNGANGLPTSITGGTTGFVRVRMFTDVTNPLPTGNYLIRTQGAGSVAVLPGTSVSSGTAGGWNYRVWNIPTSPNSFGIVVDMTAPLTGLQILFPGDWNTGTHLPTTVVNHDWSAAYGQHAYMRNMSWFYVNNGQLRHLSDYLPDGYYTQAQTIIRSVSGTILAATPTTSAFITDNPAVPIFLITHAIAGDPFQTGDKVTTGGVTWLVERVNNIQYKALGSSSTPPTGAISFDVPTTGIIEEVCRAHNELTQDMWLNLPAMLDDTAVTGVATAVLATLTAGIKVRLELSNECWNSAFDQYFYFAGLGRVNGTSGAIEYGRRAATVHKLFLTAFTAAGRAADLIRVAAWQVVDSASGKIVMDAYKAWCVAHSYSFSAPHEYAVTDYFAHSAPVGSDPAATRFRDFIMNGSNTPDPLPAAGLIDLAVWGLFNETQLYLTSSTAMITQWNTDNTAAVDVVTYEAGQAMDGARYAFSGQTSGDASSPYSGSGGTSGAGAAMNLAYARANRHPRMGNAILGCIQLALDYGIKTWGQFGTLAQWGQDGYWSDMEYFNQTPGNGDSNLADLDNIVGSQAPKLYWQQQWIAAS